jgi:hypothetical protein
VSLPATPAHIMLLMMRDPYALWQVACETTGRVTAISVSDTRPPSLVVPHPVATALDPATGSVPVAGKDATPTAELRFKGRDSLMIAMSLAFVVLLYCACTTTREARTVWVKESDRDREVAPALTLQTVGVVVGMQ